MPEAAPAVAAPEAAPLIKPSAALAGQQELAARKGSWRYEAPAAPAAPEAFAEPTDEDRPEALTAARDGGADDLKLIKGVGPKLELLLNKLGFYHFDQVGNWTAREVAWVDENLEGFKGRVTRDNWVDQARALATGAETEFSQRAKKDGIYKE